MTVKVRNARGRGRLRDSASRLVSVAAAVRREAAGGDLGDAAGGAGGRFRLRRCFLVALARAGTAAPGGEDFDPFGERVFGRRGVVPGKVEVVAAAVAGVAVVTDPAER